MLPFFIAVQAKWSGTAGMKTGASAFLHIFYYWKTSKTASFFFGRTFPLRGYLQFLEIESLVFDDEVPFLCHLNHLFRIIGVGLASKDDRRDPRPCDS
jgi:hypothetical protein